TRPCQRHLLGRHGTHPARAVLLFILGQPAADFRGISGLSSPRGQSERRWHQMRAGHRIHQMRMMPEVEVLRVEEVELEICLAVVAGTDARRCDGQVCREDRRQIDDTFVLRGCNQAFRQIATDYRERPTFTIRTTLVPRPEHAVKSTGCRQYSEVRGTLS